MSSSSWTERNLAYLAGIIDGEGCISLSQQKRGGKNTPLTQRYSSQIIIANTNPRLIHWIHAKFGGSISVTSRKNPKQKPCWLWFLGGQNIEPVLRAVLPYLVIKGEQASLMLEFRSTVNPVGTNQQMTESVRDRRQEIKSNLLVLNRRGVA